MVYLLYDIALILSSLVLIPYYLLRGMRYGKTRRGIRERLGYYDSEKLARLKGRRVIWIHAVSVGETRAAIPLLKSLRRKYPESALVLSNVTESGRAIAGEIDEIDLCLFFPFDLSWAVRRTLQQISPALILIVETEIWPNFVRIAHARGIPVMLVNGRFSDRSFPRYFSLRKYLKKLLKMFASFCMQTDQDARRARHIGAPADRITVTGNLKFDLAIPEFNDEACASIRRELRLPAGMPVWVAGSTHAGEEEVAARVCQSLQTDGIQQVLILVPRHPERARSIGEQLTAKGVRWTLRSAIDARDSTLKSGDILLVDTLGEMLNFYAIAELVFVGGSLVPVGGHNVLEASLLKKPVIFGNYMHNQKEMTGIVLESGGGIQVRDSTELTQTVGALLTQPEKCRDMGEKGFARLAEHRGATEKTLLEIERLWERSL